MRRLPSAFSFHLPRDATYPSKQRLHHLSAEPSKIQSSFLETNDVISSHEMGKSKATVPLTELNWNRNRISAAAGEVAVIRGTLRCQSVLAQGEANVQYGESQVQDGQSQVQGPQGGWDFSSRRRFRHSQYHNLTLSRGQ